MGMSSSQARLLNLTARMHQIEYKAAKLEAMKLQMANESSRVYETYLEDLAMQIEDDLCIAPSSIHEVLIFPLSLVQPARIIKTVRDVNRTVVLPQEKLSDSAYIYRRDTHIISQAILKNPDDLTCEKKH